MYKVDKCPLLYSLKQPSVIFEIQTVTADLRDFIAGCFRKADIGPFQQSQTFRSRTLLTAFKEELKSEADSEKRCSRCRDLLNDGHQIIILKAFHSITERSHPGKYNMIRLQNDLRVAGQFNLLTQIAERFQNAFYISCIVVNYSYHCFSSS